MLAALSVSLSGCGVLRHLDGSTTDEVTEYCTGQKIIRNAQGETPLEESNRKLKERLEALQVRTAEVKESRDQAQMRAKTIEEQKLELQSSVINLRDEVTDLKQQLAALKSQERADSSSDRASYSMAAIPVGNTMDSTATQYTNGLSGLKVKVLSGDGSMKSASSMARELKALGLSVERIAMAPTTNFSRHTVFYSKGMQDRASEIARNIGNDAIIKPLSWKSVFDFIVVTENHEFRLKADAKQ